MAYIMNTNLGRFALVAAAGLLLSGCTGMYLGATSNNEERQPEMSEADIHARADIHSITPETVHRLLSEQRAEADIALARRDAAELRPKSTAYNYKIDPNDVLMVTVWNHPEMNNPAGQISSDPAGLTATSDGYVF